MKTKPRGRRQPAEVRRKEPTGEGQGTGRGTEQHVGQEGSPSRRAHRVPGAEGCGGGTSGLDHNKRQSEEARGGMRGSHSVPADG